MTIYKFQDGTALGDCWQLAQKLLRLSEAQGNEEVLISGDFPQDRDYGADFTRMMLPRMARLLDSPGKFRIVDAHGDTFLHHRDLWPRRRHAIEPQRLPYMRMRLPEHRWADCEHAPIVCYQFDGHSVAQFKNPPPEDIPHLINVGPRYTPVKVGLPMTIEESCSYLAQCSLFLGVCSGMSHLAHSIRCPRIVIQYAKPVQPWHPPLVHGWYCANGTDIAIMLSRELLGLPPLPVGAPRGPLGAESVAPIPAP